MLAKGKWINGGHMATYLQGLFVSPAMSLYA